MDNSIKAILEREIKMTMGCTDPGAIAYAASQAAETLGGEITGIDVLISKNVYKNAAYVGIPVIKRFGIEYAALLGAIIKKPKLKLAVLGEIDSAVLEAFTEMQKRVPVSIQCSDIDEPLYIKVSCTGENGCASVIIKGDYDWICRIEKNGGVLYYQEQPVHEEKKDGEELDFKKLFSLALNSQPDDNSILSFEKINREAASSSFSEETKAYLGRLSGLDSVPLCDMANMARIYVLGAGKMRMSGERVPIVSLAGSGNLGIISMLTVSAVCDALRKTIREKEKALYLSALIAVYIKSKMNRLTVMCGTAVAGACGAAAATAYLLGGDCTDAENAVNTVIGSIGGILCDGAKESCAFKVGFASECAVVSGFMAVNKSGLHPGSGIITEDIDENIRNIGYINNVGMKNADDIILAILNSQKKHAI